LFKKQEVGYKGSALVCCSINLSRHTVSFLPPRFFQNAIFLALSVSPLPSKKMSNNDRLDPKMEAKYERLFAVGEGTYGVVFKAKERSSGKHVALKKIRLDHEDEGVPGTAIREVSILQTMKHPNIVDIREVHCTKEQMYLVFEFIDYDLKRYMKVHGNVVPQNQIKDLTYQMLLGVAYMHSRGILHRDLKPQNMLMDIKTMLVKLADFGLARTCRIPVRTFTHEVVTLWFRSPEILLGQKHYSAPLDVWSAGCIMGEMIDGKSLFPGDSEIDTIYKIFKLLGTPDEKRWPGIDQLPDWKPTFPNWKVPDVREKLLARYPPELYPQVGFAGIDLLSRMLEYSPDRRLTAAQALKHPWFDDLDKKQKKYEEWAPPPNVAI